MVRCLLIIQASLLLLLCSNSRVFAQQRIIDEAQHDSDNQVVKNEVASFVPDSTAYNISEVKWIPADTSRFSNVMKMNRNLKKISNEQSEIFAPVNIGYNQIRKPDEITAAIGSIRGDQLTGRSQINPENTLYGKIPGLTVLENGGAPPTNPGFFIRGQETFNNNDILVLIDGFERPLSSISTAEIEDVKVLKDAASLAFYGQRGANGVLMVTTKRGSASSLKVNAVFEQSITQPTGLPDFLEAPDYARAVNEALVNDGRSPRYDQLELENFESNSYPYLYPNVDWFDEALRDFGSQNNFKLTFQGGGERARYFVLANYAQDDGILNPITPSEDYSTQINYKRFNFRSNIDITITDDLLFKTNVAGNLFNSNIPAGSNGAANIFDALYTIPSSAFPIQTPDGNWGGTQIYQNNPLAMLASTGYGNPNGRELFVDGSLRQNLNALTEGLGVEVAASFTNFGTYNDQQTKQYRYEALNPVRDDNGEILYATSTIYGENTDLDFSFPLGQMRRQINYQGVLDYSRTFENSSLKAMILLHQDARILRGQNNTFHRRNYAANVHYGIAEKYYFDVTASYSGNNMLPKGNQFTFFPAVSAGWLISREKFLQDADFLNLLKLRASWGISGNDLLPADNPYEQSYINASGYWFRNSNNFQGGFAEDQLASSDFSVETSYKTNLGIDALLFDNLDVTIDLFYARRTNILTGTDGRVSDVIGIETALESDGIVENKGLEAAIDWRDNKGEFSYHIGGQFSFARNKIVEMNEAFRPYSYLNRTGEQIGQQFGLEAVGFFEDQDDIANSPQQVFSEVRPGDIKYKDQNGDGIINEFDEVALGHAGGYPEINFSFSLGFDYKGVGVSALFQGTGNHTAYLNTESVYRPLRNNTTISSYYYNNRWTPETSNTATLPRLTTESNDNNFRPNSIWLKDRSYLKLRTLEISYSFPISAIERWKMDKVRLFAQGMNLFSIDNIEALDPERLSVGYPILRSYNFGVEITF